MVANFPISFVLLVFGFDSSLYLMVLMLFCSATRRALCNSTVTATRNGFLWYSRKHPGTGCHCWQCSCCGWTTIRKFWPVEYEGEGILLVTVWFSPEAESGRSDPEESLFWNKLLGSDYLIFPPLLISLGQKGNREEQQDLECLVHTISLVFRITCIYNLLNFGSSLYCYPC